MTGQIDIKMLVRAICNAKAELPQSTDYQDGVRAAAENLADKLPQADRDSFLTACGYVP